MNNRIAIFPGSFDPFTIGHEDIVRRGLTLFDQIIVAVGQNDAKQSFISFENRVKLIERVFGNDPRVKVVSYAGLTVDLCSQMNVFTILRGVRSMADFEYEKQIDAVNRILRPEVESVLLFTDIRFSSVSSSVIRELYRHGGDYGIFMPSGVCLKDYISDGR